MDRDYTNLGAGAPQRAENAVNAVRSSPARAGALHEIATALDQLEALVCGTKDCIDSVVGRIFCEPSECIGTLAGDAPAESHNLPAIMSRISRIYERAASIDAQTRRLNEQL